MSCTDCFHGTIHEGNPKGKEETLHNVLTYIAAPETGPTSSSQIIFITDVFGFNLVNNKLLADKDAAETRCLVLMPNVIPGGGAPLSAIELFDSLSTHVGLFDVTGQAKRAGAAMKAVAIFAPFAVRTRNAYPKLLKFSRNVRASLPVDAKLGVAGFCWGGMHSTKLTGKPAEEGGSRALFHAHFVAHPAGLKVPDDFVVAAKRYKVSISLAVGDLDRVLSKDKIERIERGLGEAFRRDSDGYEVKTYGGCKHGFAVRADSKRTTEDEAAVEAAAQAVYWFKKHLGLMGKR
ncbi:hypothetical protein M440DRAFT_1355250 [Trichoderma longibrachiatum ATCC 18648]|uniref:Dienelactone hydrolase domain-containing protein n=1 Tax=Trichoderma longibrachiatum ATCC 18648 TaxID=983965 RepID=A0A2T4C5W2_TRILO|nr:hypothetical protein M440DRAFT_1355250 [Trichoderma longibrachiatum ATCC 18648]